MNKNKQPKKEGWYWWKPNYGKKKLPTWVGYPKEHKEFGLHGKAFGQDMSDIIENFTQEGKWMGECK